MQALMVLASTFASLAMQTFTPKPRVVIVGGTHGNEYTGVFVLEQIVQPRRAAFARAYPSLAIETLLSNPRAYEGNRRFIHEDLNRQFIEDKLVNTSDFHTSYELHRAREINAALGPKGQEASADFIIDLHSTTSNMGITIIVNSYCTIALRAAAFLTSAWADEKCDDHDDSLPASSHALRVYLHDVTQRDAPYLNSVSKGGITIEVGPTPQGLLRADVVATTERALRLLLHYLERHYSGQEPPLPSSLSLYVDQGKVAWPDAEGPASLLPDSLIAPSLQDRDFEPLHAGDPMFVRPDGRIVTYDGGSGSLVYPIFVNEAAYYYAESGRGVGLTTLADWPIT